MTDKLLGYISTVMKKLNISYAFMRYESHPGYPYCIGSYREVNNNCEDGGSESVFTLDFFTRNTWTELLALNEIVKHEFNNKTVTLSPKHTATFFYDNHYLVDDEDPGLKRMELLIRINEWSEE